MSKSLKYFTRLSEELQRLVILASLDSGTETLQIPIRGQMHQAILLTVNQEDCLIVLDGLQSEQYAHEEDGYLEESSSIEPEDSISDTDSEDL